MSESPPKTVAVNISGIINQLAYEVHTLKNKKQDQPSIPSRQHPSATSSQQYNRPRNTDSPEGHQQHYHTPRRTDAIQQRVTGADDSLEKLTCWWYGQTDYQQYGLRIQIHHRQRRPLNYKSAQMAGVWL